MNPDGGNRPAALKISAFDWTDFPSGLSSSPPVDYLRCYLADLGAGAVIEEPNYFDRDYLAELSACYSTSSRGYPNTCRRLHVFSVDARHASALFNGALQGQPTALKKLQAAYLGFIVIRPLGATPLGRTVLRWYPETRREAPRVKRPARIYHVHLAGLPLTVEGLAWQQQDSAVGACATVALWTMLHSSALDEHHAVPTTVEITRAAKAHWPLSHRIFPASEGLVVEQLCHAIRAQGLQPSVLDGDEQVELEGNIERAFSRRRFAASCAALIRSGYPALIACHMLVEDQPFVDHAVCAVGFRPAPPPKEPGVAVEDDELLEHLYIHDDNLGPSVRFALREENISTAPPVAVLDASPPPPLERSPKMPNPTSSYPRLVPFSIVAALPDEIRMKSDFLNDKAMTLANRVALLLGR